MKNCSAISLQGKSSTERRLTQMTLSFSVSSRSDTEKDNVIWVSLRSVDDFPCNEMAEQFFNGGGHLNASGGRLQCTLDEAVEITRKAIAAFGEKLKP